MALDVCQKCFALRFHALTLVPFTDFFKLCIDIGIGEEWDSKWDNFIQKQQSYGP